MRKMKKFAKGGGAEAKRDRRMEDIASDYNKAIARGMSEKEARAKRAQREADARDDYAKRTGADRTETRAAEKAAEQRLTASRRSQDKNILSVGVASEGPSRKPVDTTPAKVETPSVGAASAPKPKPKPKPATPARSDKPYQGPSVRRAAPIAPTPRYSANFGAPSVKKEEPPKSVGRQMAETSAKRQQGQIDQLGSELSGFLSKFSSTGKTRGKPKGYAKGGSVDGIAVRGKTKLKRKK